jgi:hypothetical protein
MRATFENEWKCDESNCSIRDAGCHKLCEVCQYRHESYTKYLEQHSFPIKDVIKWINTINIIIHNKGSIYKFEWDTYKKELKQKLKDI